MKKILIPFITSTMIFNHVPAIYAYEDKHLITRNDISNISIDENVISGKVCGEEFVYDLDEERIDLGDSSIYLKTTVTYISEDEKMTKSQLLELDKQMTKNRLMGMNSNDTEVTTMNLNPQVPANAPYVVAANFSKTIEQIIGEITYVANRIAFLTSVAALLTGIPYEEIIEVILVAYSGQQLIGEDLQLTVT